ncbi:MAG: pentapeptide repeat-containing protein [Patescibacteria group bacterium]
MPRYKSETHLLQLIESNSTVSGEFQIIESDALMDLDLMNIKFKNCTIRGGDFCSSTFDNCTFDNVLFKNLALVGVGFDNCNFIKCKFSNVQADFGMRNCNVGGLTITQESF